MLPISVCDNGVTSASNVGSRVALSLSFLVAAEVLGVPPAAGKATVGAAAPAPPIVSVSQEANSSEGLHLGLLHWSECSRVGWIFRDPKCLNCSVPDWSLDEHYLSHSCWVA